MLFVGTIVCGHAVSIHLDKSYSYLNNSNDWSKLFGLSIFVELFVWDFILMPIIMMVFVHFKITHVYNHKIARVKEIDNSSSEAAIRHPSK